MLFDGWHASPANLELTRGLGFAFLARLESNRLARVDRGDPAPLSGREIAAAEAAVRLPGNGELEVFRVVAEDSGAEHRAASDPWGDGVGPVRAGSGGVAGGGVPAGPGAAHRSAEVPGAT